MKNLKITLFAIAAMAIATLSTQSVAAQADNKALAQVEAKVPAQLLGNVDSEALAKVEAKADLKLMSFNLRYYKPGADGDNGWLHRKDAIVAMIREEMPDIIGLQEPHRPQVDYLKVNFQNEYATLDAGRDATTDIVKKPAGGEHLMIMYRKSRYALLNSGFFWLSETPDKPSRGWDAMCRRVTVWGLFRDKKTGEEFYFFDTHFDHIGSNARRHEAVMITEYMQKIAGEKAAVIVCGDFNTTVDHEALAPIRGWMQDARSTAAVSDNLASFNDWGKRELWIDHIFYRRCKILGYKTIVNDREHYGVPYLSDHNPIVGYFKL